MGTLYKRLLWFMGFNTGETVSAMLARQKKRLGNWWWLFPVTTLLCTFGLLLFEIWLTIHVATFKLKES